MWFYQDVKSGLMHSIVTSQDKFLCDLLEDSSIPSKGNFTISSTRSYEWLSNQWIGAFVSFKAIHESALKNVVDICNITDLKMLEVEGGNFVDLRSIKVETILM
eukprot:1089971_1